MPPGIEAPLEKWQRLADAIVADRERRERFVQTLRAEGLLVALDQEKALDRHERQVITELIGQSPTVMAMLVQSLGQMLESEVTPEIAFVLGGGPIEARLGASLPYSSVQYRLSLPGTDSRQGRR